MAARERLIARALRRLEGLQLATGAELRDARLAAGWTQQSVADASGMSRSRLVRIESGRSPRFDLEDIARVAAVLGLDASIRLYPGAGPPRDAAHAARLDALLAHARPPLRVRREVPLRARQEFAELRAWDAELDGRGKRTRFELEMRLTDLQAQERRLRLKCRDDPGDGFVLVVADSHRNRQVLRGAPGFFSDLPRLGPSRVIRALGAGQHPPSCLVVL